MEALVVTSQREGRVAVAFEQAASVVNGAVSVATDARVVKEVMGSLKSDDVVFVVGDGSRVEWVASRLVRKCRARVVYVPGPELVTGSRWANALLAKSRRLLARDAETVAVMSTGAAVDAIQAWPDANLSAWSPGFDGAAWVRGRDDELVARLGLPERYMVHLGGAVRNKQLRAAQVVAEALELDLVAVGPGSELWHAPKRHIWGLGGVGDDVRSAVVGGSWVVVSPSQYEYVNYDLLEGLAWGVPFVSSVTGVAVDLSRLVRCPVYEVYPAEGEFSSAVAGLGVGLRQVAGGSFDGEKLRGGGELYGRVKLVEQLRTFMKGERDTSRLGGFLRLAKERRDAIALQGSLSNVAKGGVD